MAKPERPPILDQLDPRYRPLWERAVDVLGADERVVEVRVGGSLALGVGDRASDLDLVVLVRDDDLDALRSEWRTWLAEITPTVLARELPGRIGIYTVTPDWLRLDVTVWPASSPPSPPAPTTASADAVAAIIDEFFRAMGLIAVVTTREDWLLGVEGLLQLRRLLYALDEQENAPQQPLGVKWWSAKLTPEQRAEIAALPPPVPDRQAIVDGHVALAAAFLPRARRVSEALGVEWPAAFEDATRAHVRRELGVELPD